MLADVQAHFGLARPFHRVGNYETEHQRTLVREVCAVVQTGRLVVVAGLVGSGKTHLLTRIEEELARSSRIAVAKSLAVDKRRTSLPSLIEAMFYDLTPGDRSKVKIPKQPERRERELRDLMRKNRHPVVLIVDEAHDLHHQTLIGFKRLNGAGGRRRGDPVGAADRAPQAAQRPAPAADGADRLPHHHFRVRGRVRQPPRVHRLAVESLRPGRREACRPDGRGRDRAARRTAAHGAADRDAHDPRLGERRVSTEVVEQVLSRAIDELEPTLTRNGYDAPALTVLLNAKPAEVRDFLAGTLAADRTREFTEQLRIAGPYDPDSPLSLAANVSTSLRWRARGDDGEHSGR